MRLVAMVDTTRAAPATLVSRVTGELLGFVEHERLGLDVEAEPLLDELEALIVAGGKRLRPVFAYWGYRAAGGEDGPSILRVGAALELLHTFAVIHDDVMDRSPLRRSRLSSFRVLAELASAAPHRGDPMRFGVSAAILTGDLALVLADRLLAASGFASEALHRATDRFDRMRLRTIAGQYLDLLASHRGETDERGARRIGALKSAWYTVADPLVIGALLHSPDERVVRVLESYGLPLGEAFQIRDDILGLYGDPARTGKDRDSDLREGKQTVLVAKARTMATDDDRTFLETNLGRPDLRAEGAERIRTIVERSGALEQTQELVGALVREAKDALDRSIIDTGAADELERLADQVAVRDS
jgi:geranylgeranyl diphosphate synthase, type I